MRIKITSNCFPFCLPFYVLLFPLHPVCGGKEIFLPLVSITPTVLRESLWVWGLRRVVESRWGCFSLFSNVRKKKKNSSDGHSRKKYEKSHTKKRMLPRSKMKWKFFLMQEFFSFVRWKIPPHSAKWENYFSVLHVWKFVEADEKFLNDDWRKLQERKDIRGELVRCRKGVKMEKKKLLNTLAHTQK
jgi:hypothetical protein